MAWDKLAMIAIGGAAGALLRYGSTELVQHRLFGGWAFPWGTLAVNMVGCLCIGLLAGFLADRTHDVRVHALLSVGLLGALTTFSTFTLESLALIEQGRRLLAAVNIVGSCIGGLALAALGLWAGKALAVMLR